MLEISEDDTASGLKVQDYIGLSDALSGACSKVNALSENTEDTLQDTDLRLELGLGLGLPSGPAVKAEGDRREAHFARQDSSQIELICASSVSGLGSSFSSKKWTKRGFQDAMIAMSSLKNAESDAAQSKHGSFALMWSSSNSTVPTWRPGVHDTITNHAPVMGRTHTSEDKTENVLVNDGRSSKDRVVGWPPVRGRSHTLEDKTENANVNDGPSSKDRFVGWPPVRGRAHTSEDQAENAIVNDGPPSKNRVVGWPPVRSYRRQTLAQPAETFVKVNMDGITVGRKVDLNAYSSYESLLQALEEMFQPSINVAQVTSSREHDLKHFLLASDSEYVLTYEDKDGDWMLVGDVPWSMFVSTVKRLRITRGSEATGSGTGALDELSLHGR
ncbi:hypothetical protein KP509_12G058100 [Ceratopteris richardii]|uniref:Auxin-responsive protein n=1 Tax=Ceratopteris richardii TaxID=49495 RepID=A0A8T2TP61_CERRI|nr:hypothetical protein KP509_12G058100 [Ceratopteris richardii]